MSFTLFSTSELDEQAKAVARLVGDSDPSEQMPVVLSGCVALVERPLSRGEPGETDRHLMLAEVERSRGAGWL